MYLKDDILKLRSEGLTYNEIQKILSCSKASISYHCGEGQKTKNLLRTSNAKKKDNLKYNVGKKISRFNCHKKESILYEKNIYKTTFMVRITAKCLTFSEINSINMSKVKAQNILNMLEANPRCALTGKILEIQDTRSWHLDHIIPSSRQGDNSLENCQIVCREANQAKSDLLPEEFLELCKTVLEFHGYNIEKQL